MFNAMNRRPAPSLKTPVTASAPKRNRSHRNSRDEGEARAKLREEDAKVKARVEKRRAQRAAGKTSQERSKLPDWAHRKIEEANSRAGRGSP